MVANTGTYLDSPFHRYADGRDLSELELDEPGQPGLRGRAGNGSLAGGRSIEPDRTWMVAGQGRALSHRLGSRIGGPINILRVILISPGVSPRRWLQAGVSAGRDRFVQHRLHRYRRAPGASALLGAEIPIVEHLRGLAAVPERGARFYAVPVKVKGMGTFPVRAFVRLTTC